MLEYKEVWMEIPYTMVVEGIFYLTFKQNHARMENICMFLFYSQTSQPFSSRRLNFRETDLKV